MSTAVLTSRLLLGSSFRCATLVANHSNNSGPHAGGAFRYRYRQSGSPNAIEDAVENLDILPGKRFGPRSCLDIVVLMLEGRGVLYPP
jgi:hypothetical protein